MHDLFTRLRAGHSSLLLGQLEVVGFLYFKINIFSLMKMNYVNRGVVTCFKYLFSTNHVAGGGVGGICMQVIPFSSVEYLRNETGPWTR